MGEQVQLPEICAMVREDPNYQNLTKEQEQEMKDEVMALCQDKKVELTQQINQRHWTIVTTLQLSTIR